MSTLYYESSISHHGIKGQKWGVRRFQNPDGSLTRVGQVRYGGRHGAVTLTPRDHKRYQREIEKVTKKQQKERQRLALEEAKIREARKTEQARIKLQKEKESLAKERSLAKSKQVDSDSKAPSYKNKRVSEMTDAEVSALIARLDLEQKLSALSNPPKKDDPFKKWLLEAAARAGGYALDNFGKEAGTRLGKALFADADDKKK